MWGYASGVKFYGAKVKLVGNVDFGVKWICGIPWCMVQTTKTNPKWIGILWHKTPLLLLLLLYTFIYGANHHKITNGTKTYIYHTLS